MSYKILLNPNVKKTITILPNNEKVQLTKALDMMESLGQMGEILFHDLNVWKYRVENLRIIYRKKSDELIILAINKGSDSSIEYKVHAQTARN
jgi:mRNA-degrading endonuclease RelE of RelBE toxin-antitoxin system